jgi:L-threonylcarbamoyladenylate synthase
MENARLDAAAECVRDGGLIAYPTETVWGLGADACSDAALDGLRRWKGRAGDAPVSILVSGPEALEGLGFPPCERALFLAKRFWPGPLTLVLPCEGLFARGVARDDGAVGVRCSPHRLASELTRRVQALGAGPLTSTSLNESGRPPAATLSDARRWRRAQHSPRPHWSRRPRTALGGAR